MKHFAWGELYDLERERTKLSTDPESIFQAIMRLPEEDRFELESRSLNVVPDEPEGLGLLSVEDPNFREELDRRFVSPEGAISWEDLRDRNG